MSWLASFDPSSASSSSSAQRNLAPSQPDPGPSSARPRPPHSYFRRTGPYPSRPPRSRAAPRAASLRSEDSQPNEGARRGRPWELDAPPTIGSKRALPQQRNVYRSPSVRPQPSGSRPPAVGTSSFPSPFLHADSARAGPSTVGRPSSSSLVRPPSTPTHLSSSALRPAAQPPLRGAAMTTQPTSNRSAIAPEGEQKPSKKARKRQRKATEEAAAAAAAASKTEAPTTSSSQSIGIEDISPGQKKWDPEARSMAEDLISKHLPLTGRQSRERTIKQIRSAYLIWWNDTRAARKVAKAAKAGAAVAASGTVAQQGAAVTAPQQEDEQRTKRYEQHLKQTAAQQEPLIAPPPYSSREEEKLTQPVHPSLQQLPLPPASSTPISGTPARHATLPPVVSVSMEAEVSALASIESEVPPLDSMKYCKTGATLGSLLAMSQPSAATVRQTERSAIVKLEDGPGSGSPAAQSLSQPAQLAQPPFASTPSCLSHLEWQPKQESLFGSGLALRDVFRSSPDVEEPVPMSEDNGDDEPLAARLCSPLTGGATSVETPEQAAAAAPPMFTTVTNVQAQADDDDNTPLMLQSRAIDLTEDSDEDIPLWQERGRSELALPTTSQVWPTPRLSPSSAAAASNVPSFAVPESSSSASITAMRSASASSSSHTAAATGRDGGGAGGGPLSVRVAGVSPLQPVPPRLHLTINFLAPIASRSFAPAADGNPRMRKAAFDTTLAVSKNGTLACLGANTLPIVKAEPMAATAPAVDGPTRCALEFRGTMPKPTPTTTTTTTMTKTGASDSGGIDTVEDVRRLTSKVVGIASSTTCVLGIGPQPQPHQVSLVTVDDAGRRPRVYHLDQRPHPQGAFAISSFPNTARDDATSVDFATGGSEGVVNHWRWSTRGRCKVERLHTIHGSWQVTALEHLSARHNLLVSASHGQVVGFDVSQLNLCFTWPTSERIVHLQRTPNPDLILSTCARRDYDQFRLYDVTGRNGPVSRSVISFGWLNNTEGRRTLGRGSFHPTRRSVFAYGSKDGYVRIWDMRMARDPLLVEKVGDEPLGDVVWKGDAEGEGGSGDVVFVATPRGMRSVELNIERR